MGCHERHESWIRRLKDAVPLHRLPSINGSFLVVLMESTVQPLRLAHGLRLEPGG